MRAAALPVIGVVVLLLSLGMLLCIDVRFGWRCLERYVEHHLGNMSPVIDYIYVRMAGL